MQDKHLFEYAVIRIVPKVEREEFLNVGVVLYVHQLKFLEMRFSIPEERLRAFSATTEPEEIEAYLEAFGRICKGCEGAGPIGLQDPASRFRWLTAYRSTIIQTSRVHPGFCTDPAVELERLYRQLVL